MKEYYLSVEGVNLANFVYDTQDLSTIRGGGLLLLNSIKRIKANFNLEEISTGASSGIFKFEAENDDEAEELRKKVDDWLRNEEQLKHATFVVDYAKKSDNFRIDRETLIAKNRSRQMQAPSLIFPDKTSEHVCPRDLIHPATDPDFDPEDNTERKISESVCIRRTYGKVKKHKFYYEQTKLEWLKDKKFAYEFSQIAENADKGNLNNKMAVIYIDGNDFGKIQSNIKSETDQIKWDKTIKDYRKEMLAALLIEMEKDDDWKGKDKDNKEIYRMETLLWGGDEIIWVVPAWKGWRTLQFFYNHAKEKNWNWNGKCLEHAAGLVFCHSKAPIHRITKLAKALAEMAKEEDRGKSLFAYQTLESFDHVGDDLERFYGVKTKGTLKIDDFVLEGNEMKEIAIKIKKLKENEFPRSKIYQICMAIIEHKPIEDIENLEKKALEHYRKKDDDWNSLKSFLKNKATAMHVAELWDYIV